jgi:imidazoleglycerol phosphate dehydratase HisB
MEGEDTGHALAAIFKALGVALSRAAAAPTKEP